MENKRQQLAEALLYGLSDELKKEREACLAELRQHNKKNLSFYHALGKRIAAIRANPGKYQGSVTIAGRTYEPVDRLAKTLGSSEQVIYKSLQFYSKYPLPKDLERLSDIQVKGKPLTWTAVIKLCGIEDAADRLMFEKRIQAEGLEDAKEIQYVLEEERGKLGGGGRPVSVPKSAKQGLRQATVGIKAFKKKCEESWFGIRFDLAARLVDEMDNLDEEDLVAVERLGDMQLELASILKKNGQLLKTKSAQLAGVGASRDVPQQVGR